MTAPHCLFGLAMALYLKLHRAFIGYSFIVGGFVVVVAAAGDDW